MRTIRYSNRFKRDYKREKAGRYSKQLDTALAELLITDVPLLRRNFDHPLSADGLFRRRSSRDAGAEPALDVLDDDLLEIGGDRRAAQGRGFLAVDEDRRGRRFAGAGQRNADVGVLGFARAVDDAAHHRDVEAFDAWIARLPFRHGVANEALDAGGKLLERGRGGAAAAGAGGNERHEGAQADSLQQFLRDLHFKRAVAVRLGRQRDADRVAYTLLQQ